jgi:hypothetical protein
MFFFIFDTVRITAVKSSLNKLPHLTADGHFVTNLTLFVVNVVGGDEVRHKIVRYYRQSRRSAVLFSAVPC